MKSSFLRVERMRSLPKVIKSELVIQSESVVHIPDQMPVLFSPRPEDFQLEYEVTGDEGGEDLRSAQLTDATDRIIPREVYELAVRRAEEQANEIAEEILHKAQQEREEILAQARQEADETVRQARTDAQTAVEQAKEEQNQKWQQLAGQVLETIRQTEESLARVEQSHQAFFAEYNQQLAPLALEIAAKIMAKKITMDPLELSSLVEQAVSTVKTAEWVTVEVSDRLPELVQHLKTQLEQNDKLHCRVEVQVKDAPLGLCRVHTPEQVTDASISAQLDSLNEYFESMNSQRDWV